MAVVQMGISVLRTPRTPRSPLEDNFNRVPPRPDHCFPRLDFPSVSSDACASSENIFVSHPDSHRFSAGPHTNMDSQNGSLQSLLIVHFDRLYSCHAQMLERMSSLEQKCVETGATANKLLRSVQSRRNGGATISPHKTMHRSFDSAITGSASVGNMDFLRASASVSNTDFRMTPASSSSGKMSIVDERRDADETAISAIAVKAMPSKKSQATTAESVRNVYDLQLAQAFQQHTSHDMRNRTPWAKSVWQFLENRDHSTLARIYAGFFVPLFIILSVAVSFTQTVKEWTMPSIWFSSIQTIFEALFAIELVIRFMVCPNRWDFWLETFNQIDMISIMPLFVRPFVWNEDGEGGSLRQVIALVPMVRLLKILRRFQKFHILISAFKMALEALPVLIFTLSLIAILFSCLMYSVESKELLPSLPKALWFVIVTMTTVGYGDITPETTAGCVLAGLLMVLSALYMAIPIGIVGQAFSQAWGDRDRLLLFAALHDKFAVSGTSTKVIQDMFTIFDSEGGDPEEQGEVELGLSEFKRLMGALDLGLTDDRIVALFNALDANGDQTISCDEFIHALFPIYKYKKNMLKNTVMKSFSRFGSASGMVGASASRVGKTASSYSV